MTAAVQTIQIQEQWILNGVDSSHALSDFNSDCSKKVTVWLFDLMFKFLGFVYANGSAFNCASSRKFCDGIATVK